MTGFDDRLLTEIRPYLDLFGGLSPQQAADLAGRMRGEPVRLVRLPLRPADPTGCWYRTRETDPTAPGGHVTVNWLVVDAALGPVLSTQAAWHELLHLVRDDVPLPAPEAPAVELQLPGAAAAVPARLVRARAACRIDGEDWREAGCELFALLRQRETHRPGRGLSRLLRSLDGGR